MAFIDWSDGDNLYDMLVEYVSDAMTEAHGDARRGEFLEKLLSDLTTAQNPDSDVSTLAKKLNQIIQSVDPEFSADPVMDHVTACLEELDRLNI